MPETPEESVKLPEVQAPEQDVPKTTAEKKAELKAQMQELERIERTEGRSGLIPNAPKQNLLNAVEVEMRPENKDRHLRWLSTRNPDKIADRIARGYTKLPVVDGGREVGSLVLFSIPREEYERREKEKERQHELRLNAHNTDIENAAENIAKILRDQHGMKVNAKDILIRER